MEFSVLGPLEVSHDGTAVSIRRGPPRGLLISLLLHRRVDNAEDHPALSAQPSPRQFVGRVCAIFGAFALGVYLTRGRSVRLALVAMIAADLGNVLFLYLMSLSTFATPAAARAYLAGVANIDQLQQNDLADRCTSSSS